jgi:hypothetical protein
MVKKNMKQHLRYMRDRYVRREQARLTVTIKDGRINIDTAINKTADEHDKIIYWAVRGILYDVLSMAGDQKAGDNIAAMAFMSLRRSGVADDNFSVPESYRAAMTSAKQMRDAGVIPPCGKPGECNTDECKTCLQNPNLATDDVTLASLTKGSKF